MPWTHHNPFLTICETNIEDYSLSYGQTINDSQIETKEIPNPYYHYEKLIDIAIEMHKDMMLLNKEKMRQMSLSNSLNNFCFLELSFGRNVGATTYIKNHAKEDDLIIVQDNTIVRNYNYDSRCDSRYVLSLSDLWGGTERLRGFIISPPSKVWVDCNNSKRDTITYLGNYGVLREPVQIISLGV